MADRTIHVFEQNGGLAVFPSQLPVKGRGADHIQLCNSTEFDVHWHIPSGVFDDVNDHDEDIAAGQCSVRHKVKGKTAKAVAYQVTLLRRAAGKRKARRRLGSIKSDPIIIIDIDRRKKRR